jgi:hypothetical protein
VNNNHKLLHLSITGEMKGICQKKSGWGQVAKLDLKNCLHKKAFNHASKGFLRKIYHPRTCCEIFHFNCSSHCRLRDHYVNYVSRCLFTMCGCAICIMLGELLI